jgi:hypothetical protein
MSGPSSFSWSSSCSVASVLVVLVLVFVLVLVAVLAVGCLAGDCEQGPGRKPQEGKENGWAGLAT